MSKKTICLAVSALLFALCFSADAQQPKAYRIAVLLPGETWHEIVDGLRVGLRELGLEEGKQFVLSIRDWKGDAKMAEEAARKFEQEKVNLIYATSTNSTVAARRATAEIPIVFCAGTDPVVLGLVDSFANPGGRLTGVYNRSTDLTAKRLESLTASPLSKLKSSTCMSTSLCSNAWPCRLWQAKAKFQGSRSTTLAWFG